MAYWTGCQSYIGRENDWRRGQIQLRDVERLGQEVRRIQLVESSGPVCLGHLRGLRLASHLHASHALGDAGDASGRTLTTRRLVSLIRSLVAAICGLRCGHGLLCAIAGLGILVSSRRGSASSRLRFTLRIGAVRSSTSLDRRHAVLLSDW